MAIYSEFSHQKWWFSIAFCMFTRGYNPLLENKTDISCIFCRAKKQIGQGILEGRHGHGV